MSATSTNNFHDEKNCLWASLEHVLLCGEALVDCLKNKFSEKQVEQIRGNSESFYVIIKQQSEVSTMNPQ